MMKCLVSVALVAGGASAGCVLDDPANDDLATTNLGVSESAIIGGARSLGVEATVMLAGFPPDRSILHSCTAVVVTPTVLLTSAHCVDAPNHPNYLYGVFTGDDASPYPNLVALEPQLKSVKSVHPHPQYSPNLPFYADIAVVVMNAPLPITPLPMQRTPIDSSLVGKPARIVGYGQVVYGQFNQARHEAMTTVAALDNDTIVVGDTQKRSCLGDSGGPAIVDGVVVGIDSYGPVGCDAPAHYRRVDTFMPFISQYAPPSDPAEPNPEPTPDPMMGDDSGGGCTVASSTNRGNRSVPWLVLAALVFARTRRRR